MKKLREGDLVCIHWNDQCFYVGPALAENALQKSFGRSVGFFVSQDERWLCIAAERFVTSENSNDNYRQIMSFPKACITKIQVVELTP
jgi:uncharacterized protein (DUF1697 family)